MLGQASLSSQVPSHRSLRAISVKRVLFPAHWGGEMGFHAAVAVLMLYAEEVGTEPSWFPRWSELG